MTNGIQIGGLYFAEICYPLAATTGMNDQLQKQGQIGKDWFYNNVAYQKLKTALTIQTGLELNALTQAWLFEPLGITDANWVTRAKDADGHQAAVAEPEVLGAVVGGEPQPFRGGHPPHHVDRWL